MKKEIKQEIENLKIYGEKTLGVFGARATGKTVYFTTLYGLSGFNNSDETLSVICNDKNSRSYLKKNYKKLLEGKVPSRTEVNEINEINMSYFHNKNSYHLRSFDFAGELIKDVSDEESSEEFLELQNQIYEFFGNCSALLIFLEPSDSKQETFERQAEIERLFDFLKKTKKNWDFDIPISLVVSKWDKINDVVEGYDYKAEEKKAVEYIKNHKIYNNIYSLVSGLTSQSKIFPVSAFGTAREGDLPPHNIVPFNLFSPLVWASKARNEAWSKKVINILDKNISSKNGKRIVEEFKDNISNEKILDPVITKYKEFKKQKFRKKAIITFFVIASIATGVGYRWNYNNNKESYYKDVITENNPEKQLEKLNSFLTMYNNDGKLGKELLNKRKNLYVTIIEDTSTLEGKLKKVNNFLRGEKINGAERAELIKTQNEIKEKIRIKEKYAELQKKIAAETDNLKKYDLINNYIQSNEVIKNESELQEEMKKYLRLADRNSYQKIVSLKNENSEKVHEEIENYLSNARFTEYRQEVQEIKSELYDVFLYNNVKKSISEYNEKLTIEALNDVQQESDTYLSNNILGRSKDEVQRISQKVSEIKKGYIINVEVFFNTQNTNYNLNNKTILSTITVGNTEYDIRKETNGNSVYLTTIQKRIKLNTNVSIDTYITDQKTGTDEHFKDTKFKINDFNSNNIIKSDDKSINLEMRADVEPYKIY
ncbi:MAG: hypothetical protein ACQERZ_05215 [Fusobacteriota bacterium]